MSHEAMNKNAPMPKMKARLKSILHGSSAFDAVLLTQEMISEGLAAYGIKAGDWMLTGEYGTQFLPDNLFQRFYDRWVFAPRGLPTDEMILAHLRERPRRTLRQLCEHFDLPWAYSPLCRGENGKSYGYSNEARQLAQMLQRLRRNFKIYQEGQRWFARSPKP